MEGFRAARVRLAVTEGQLTNHIPGNEPFCLEVLFFTINGGSGVDFRKIVVEHDFRIHSVVAVMTISERSIIVA